MENQHNIPAWGLMADAKAVLGIHGLERVFQVGHKQLYKQMRNPDLGGEHARPVIDRTRVLVSELNDMGGAETAHAILQFMALPAGYTCIPIEQAVPTCSTVEAECLEDYPTLVKLHQAIDKGESMRSVQALLDQHIDEVRQSVTIYEQKQGEK